MQHLQDRYLEEECAPFHVSRIEVTLVYVHNAGLTPATAAQRLGLPANGPFDARIFEYFQQVRGAVSCGARALGGRWPPGGGVGAAMHACESMYYAYAFAATLGPCPHGRCTATRSGVPWTYLRSLRASRGRWPSARLVQLRPLSMTARQSDPRLGHACRCTVCLRCQLLLDPRATTPALTCALTGTDRVHTTSECAADIHPLCPAARQAATAVKTPSETTTSQPARPRPASSTW